MSGPPGTDPLAEFFAGRPRARALYDQVARVAGGLGPVEFRVGRSQVALWRAHPFAAVWVPEQYLTGPAAHLVLTIYLRQRDPSPRWKQVVEPWPGRFTHHLELQAVDDVDAEVQGWLRAAWEAAS